MKDNFGNRMKEYEAQEAGRRFIRGLPVYVRIDSRSFSRFTKTIEIELEPEILERIPADKRPNGPVTRSKVEWISMPPFNKVENRVGVIFDGEEPRLAK